MKKILINGSCLVAISAISLLTACNDNKKLTTAVSLKMPSEVSWKFGQARVMAADGVVLGSDSHDNASEDFAVTIPGDSKIDGSSLEAKIWGLSDDADYQGFWEYGGRQALNNPLPEQVTVDVKRQVKKIAVKIDGLNNRENMTAKLSLAEFADKVSQGAMKAVDGALWQLMLPAGSDSVLEFAEQGGKALEIAPLALVSGNGILPMPAKCQKILFTTRPDGDPCQVDLGKLADGAALVSQNNECAIYAPVNQTLPVKNTCYSTLTNDDLKALFGDKWDKLTASLDRELCPASLDKLPAWPRAKLKAAIKESGTVCEYDVTSAAAGDIPAGTVYLLNRPAATDVGGYIEEIIAMGGSKYLIVTDDMTGYYTLYELDQDNNNQLKQLAARADLSARQFAYDGKYFYDFAYDDSVSRYTFSADGSSLVVDRILSFEPSEFESVQLLKVLENPLNINDPLYLFYTSFGTIELCVNSTPMDNMQICMSLISVAELYPDLNASISNLQAYAAVSSLGILTLVMQIDIDINNLDGEDYSFRNERKLVLAHMKIMPSSCDEGTTGCLPNYELVEADGAKFERDYYPAVTISDDMNLLGVGDNVYYYYNDSKIVRHRLTVDGSTDECIVACDEYTPNGVCNYENSCDGRAIAYNANMYAEIIAILDGKLAIGYMDRTETVSQIATYDLANAAAAAKWSNLKSYILNNVVKLVYDAAGDVLLTFDYYGSLYAVDLQNGTNRELQANLGEIIDAIALDNGDILVASRVWRNDKENDGQVMYDAADVIYILRRANNYQAETLYDDMTLNIHDLGQEAHAAFSTVVIDGQKTVIIQSLRLGESEYMELLFYNGASDKIEKLADHPELLTAGKYFDTADGRRFMLLAQRDLGLGYSAFDGTSWQSYYVTIDGQSLLMQDAANLPEDYRANRYRDFVLADGDSALAFVLMDDNIFAFDYSGRQQASNYLGKNYLLNGASYFFDIEVPELLEPYVEACQDEMNACEVNYLPFTNNYAENMVTIPAVNGRPELLCYSEEDRSFGGMTIYCVADPSGYLHSIKDSFDEQLANNPDLQEEYNGLVLLKW